MLLHCVSVAHSQFTQLKRDVRDWRRNLKITICCITKLSWPLICLGEWMSPNLLTLKGHIPAKSSQRDYYMSSRIGAAASGLCFSGPGLHQSPWRWRPCCFQMSCTHDLLGFFTTLHRSLLLHTQWLPKDALDPCQAEIFSTFQGKENSLSPLPFREGKSSFLLCKDFLVSWEQFSLLFTKVLFRQEYLGPSVWVWVGGIFQFPHRAHHICDRSRLVQAPVPHSTWKHCCHPFFFFILYFSYLSLCHK